MKKFLFLLLFTLITLNIIQCEIDCSSCTKDSTNKKCICDGDEFKDCLWMKINSNEDSCMDCTGIKDGERQYYSRQYSTDNKPFVHKIGTSGYSGAKMIYGTKQIVSNCKEYGLFNLGDFCYDSCPANSKDNSDKMCNCENLFSKEIIEGLTYYNCIEDGGLCPEGYFYRNDKECVKACPKGKTYLEKVGDTKDYICKAQCRFNLKIYSEKAPLGNKINTYCYQKCPDKAKYYYDDDNICLEKCSKNKKDFYNKDDKCIYNNNVKTTDCGNSYYIKVSEDENILQCVQSETQSIECPEEFQYKYIVNMKTYCLKTCADTNIEFFDNVVSYLYTKNKECIDTSQLNTLHLYMIEKEKRIVDDWSEEIYIPFYDGNKCVPNCGDKYIDNDTNECLEDSKVNNYFKDEKTKICFKKCPDYLGRGFYDENNICVSCGIEGDGKGFHKEADDDDNKCYSTCPENFKHNYLNNICFEGECKVNDYKYTYDGHPEICYYTCKDIGEDYKIEKDYKCYNSIDDTFKDYYFYQTDYGFKKYLKKSSAIKECFSNWKRYLRNNECVEKCDSYTEYKVYPTIDKFGFCFNDITECKNNNYKFFNNSKICSNKCDYYTIRGETPVNLEINNENCVTKCPDDYPYLDNKLCKAKCSNYYSDENGVKKCQNSCYDYIINEWRRWT